MSGYKAHVELFRDNYTYTWRNTILRPSYDSLYRLRKNEPMQKLKKQKFPNFILFF